MVSLDYDYSISNAEWLRDQLRKRDKTIASLEKEKEQLEKRLTSLRATVKCLETELELWMLEV